MSKQDKKSKKNKEEDSDKKSIRVGKILSDFDIHVNTFGEIISNYDVDKINDFLNKTVEDKKLKNRKDLDFGKKDQEEDDSDKTD